MNWRNGLKKIAIKLIPLTNEMIVNGAGDWKGLQEDQYVTIGDIVVCNRDITINYNDKPLLLFREGIEYEVTNVAKQANSSYWWLFVKISDSVTWAISFDEKFKGGAENFSKQIQDDEDKKEQFLSSPDNGIYVNAILNSLYNVTGDGKLRGVSLKIEDLISRAEEIVLENFSTIPTEADIKKLEPKLRYHIKILVYMKLLETVQNIVRLTREGLEYIKTLGVIS